MTDASPTPAPAPDSDTDRGFLMRSVPVGGTDRRYTVFVPSAYDPATPSPAIVFLNGKGECGTDGLLQLTAGLGPAVIRDVKRWPFVILFPQKRDPEIPWGDDEAVVLAALGEARRELNLDPARIHLTGISQGGNGTWAIAARHPGLFASLVVVCGWSDEATIRAAAAIPAWIFHGEDDPVVPVRGGRDAHDWTRAAGGTSRLTVYPGVGHCSWDRAYAEPELPGWLSGQRKPS
jgi:predicted peptidase